MKGAPNQIKLILFRKVIQRIIRLRLFLIVHPIETAKFKSMFSKIGIMYKPHRRLSNLVDVLIPLVKAMYHDAMIGLIQIPYVHRVRFLLRQLL